MPLKLGSFVQIIRFDTFAVVLGSYTMQNCALRSILTVSCVVIYVAKMGFMVSFYKLIYVVQTIIVLKKLRIN